MFIQLKEEKYCIYIGILCLTLLLVPLFGYDFIEIILHFAIGYLSTLKIILLLWIILVFKLAFSVFKQYLFIKHTPISKLNSAAQGYIAVNGITAQLPNQPLLSLINQQPCVWYNYTIIKEQFRWNNFNNIIAIFMVLFVVIKKIFHPKDTGLFETATSTQEFILKDLNGECIVFPDDANVISKVTKVWYSDDLYQPKDFNKLSSKQNIFKYLCKYKYEETLLLPGEKLYVSGFFRSGDHKNNLGDIISKQGLLFGEPFIIYVGDKSSLQKKLNIKFFFYILLFIIVIAILLSIDSWYIDFVRYIKLKS